MASNPRLRFTPDYAIPPGDTLRETLEALGMTQTDLAARAGRPVKTINEIVQGQAAITPDTALQLERVLSVPASFWLNREQRYREALARRAEREALQPEIGWLRSFPVTEMVKLGWLPACRTPVERMQAVLQFLGVAGPEQWNGVTAEAAARFRMTKAHEPKSAALHAWLRRGEIEGRRMACGDYDKDAFRAVLSTVRALTLEPPEIFQPALVARCAAVGVAVVFVPELKGSRAAGATRWLSPSRALIQLSLRYKSDDHLWFTFFHEAGHVVLHGRKDIFIEERGQDDGEFEREADAFARDLLVPRAAWTAFTARLQPPRISAAEVERFATAQGLAPGIIVGRLQHERLLPQSHLIGLKRRLAWKHDASDDTPT